jgi:hypothetical protein
MSKKYSCQGEGVARMLRVSELRRLGVNRRLNTRYLTNAELRDHESTPDAEERYLDSIDELWAMSIIEMRLIDPEPETITLDQLRASLKADGPLDE